MAIQTSCPNCEAAYTLADTQRGKKVRCRKCSENFVVGGDKAAANGSPKSGKSLRKDALQTSTRAPARSTPPPKTKPAPRRGRDRDDEDEDDRSDDRPALKKKSGGSAMPMILMIGGGILLLLVLCGGGGVAVVYFWTRSAVTDTIDNIAQNMPPGDPNAPQIQIDPNGNPIIVDPNQPKDVGEALDWVKNGATADKKNKAADWLAKAGVDDGRRAEVAKALEKMLDNPNTKDAGVRGLSAWAGPENAPALLREVDTDGNLWMWGKAGDVAGDALVRLQYAPAAEVFAKRLTDWSEHGNAARRLAALGGPIAEPAVLKYMNSGDGNAHSEAEKLLRQFGTKPEVMFNQAVADLKNTDSGYQRTACDYLAKAPVNEARRAEVSKALDVALNDNNGDTRKAAAAALKVWATKDNVPGLIALLKSEPPFYPHFGEAVDALVMLKDVRGAEAIAELLPDAFKSDEAVRALQNFGPIAESAVATYVTHPNADVRAKADQLLTRYKTKESVKFDAKVAGLDAADAGLRKSTAEWLANHPVDDAHQKQIARALDKLLDDPDPFNGGGIRQAGAKAEAVWGDKESVPALIHGMQKDNSDNWQECMDALAKLKDERAVIPLLAESAKGKPHVDQAVRALNQMGPVVETALDNALNDPAATVGEKVTIIQLLGASVGTKTSVPVLTTLSTDTNPDVKKFAAAALKKVQQRSP